MNIKQNDKLYRQIQKCIKERKEMAKYARTEQERQEDQAAIFELVIQAATLTARL